MALKENIQQSSGELCQRFGIKKLGLFGSVARGDDTVDSDIDFFAEFDSPTPETMPDRYLGFIREVFEIWARCSANTSHATEPTLQRSIEKDLTIIHGQ